jgi:Fic family protein
MCDYVNDQWSVRTALHLAAYVMWRLNWIHPFTDGNGRTSRISSYVILTIKAGSFFRACLRSRIRSSRVVVAISTPLIRQMRPAWQAA